MVLVCKNLNQRFNINTYHHNLIQNKAINIHNEIKDNAYLNKINSKNKLTKVHYDDIKNITENEYKNINKLMNRTYQKEIIFLKNFVKIKD